MGLHMRWVVSGFLVSFSFVARADAGSALQDFILQEFSDARYEVVCHSTPDTKGKAIIHTVDNDAIPLNDSKRPEDFPVNIWYVSGLADAKPKLDFGIPGIIQLLQKTVADTRGGGQRNFTTWILKSNAPGNNPVNYHATIFDRSEAADRSVEIAATLLGSPLMGRESVALVCPTFKLK